MRRGDCISVTDLTAVTCLSYISVTLTIGYATMPRPRLTDEQKVISRKRSNGLTRARMARYRQRLAEQSRGMTVAERAAVPRPTPQDNIMTVNDGLNCGVYSGDLIDWIEAYRSWSKRKQKLARELFFANLHGGVSNDALTVARGVRASKAS